MYTRPNRNLLKIKFSTFHRKKGGINGDFWVKNANFKPIFETM